MDWGTPRLVTKNRALTMNSKQMESRSFLLKTVGIKQVPGRGGMADNSTTKTGYTNASLTNFRKKMMEEEKRSEAGNMMHKDLTRKKDGSEDDDCELKPAISFDRLSPPRDKLARS